MTAADLVPESFATLVAGRPAEGFVGGDQWLRELPALLEALFAQWDLCLDGRVRHGMCAVVLPVRRDGTALALKVTWPHPEAEHEHLALRAWAGRGAVRLVAADPSRWAMLLERLNPDRDLLREPIDAACAAIGALHDLLGHPALPQLRRLSDIAADTANAFAVPISLIPRRFAEQARSLCLQLASDAAVDRLLVHTDLHFENVLADDLGRWRAIDPKAVAGDPAYGVAPVLWNRFDEAVASRDVRRHLRRRLAVVCEAAGVDRDRARGWTIVREVENAGWAARDGDMSRVTAAIAIIKAMQA